MHPHRRGFSSRRRASRDAHPGAQCSPGASEGLTSRRVQCVFVGSSSESSVIRSCHENGSKFAGVSVSPGGTSVAFHGFTRMVQTPRNPYAACPVVFAFVVPPPKAAKK